MTTTRSPALTPTEGDFPCGSTLLFIHHLPTIWSPNLTPGQQDSIVRSRPETEKGLTRDPKRSTPSSSTPVGALPPRRPRLREYYPLTVHVCGNTYHGSYRDNVEGGVFLRPEDTRGVRDEGRVSEWTRTGGDRNRRTKGVKDPRVVEKRRGSVETSRPVWSVDT